MTGNTSHLDIVGSSYLAKVRRRLLTEATRAIYRRRLVVELAQPLISFTFDDFPRSAFTTAGSILKRHGVFGTYYASLNLMGKDSPVGRIFYRDDLKDLTSQGHELGCHTFEHCHSWNTPADQYERAILKNQWMLNDVLPNAFFRTFSYPYSAPQLSIKKMAGTHFLCCRGGGLRPGKYLHRHDGGGQTFNCGVVDLNYLCAFFLEKSRDAPGEVKRLIDENSRAGGWLIFATHDVRTDPSPYGCTPAFFEQVVQWSLDSGARVLPVVQALSVLQRSQENN